MLRQIFAVAAMNFKSLPGRFWPSLVIVVGMACVIGVLVSMLSFTAGYVRSEAAAGDPGRAIVIGSSTDNETVSNISRVSVGAIMDAPGIRKDPDGSPIADAEILVTSPAMRKIGLSSTLLMRGLGRKGLELRPEMKLISGRMFRPGAQELIVGAAAQDQFAGLNVGDKVIMPDGSWPIVGTFTTGDVLEGELIADNDTLMGAARHPNYNSVIARLDSAPDSLAALKNSLTTNPSLAVTVERHSDYYRHFTEAYAAFFDGATYTVGAIMAIGALFGALNTMYAAVAARGREIATLRAIGFDALPVAISVVSEAMLLALAGALIGSAAAWALFDGAQKAFFNDVFNLAVTPGLIGLGIVWALAVALLGGLLPSIRAVRLPIVNALRAT
jgi:putative ABC transport system permease protein